MVVLLSTCQTLGTGGVNILRVSVGWCCSGVHVTLLVSVGCWGSVHVVHVRLLVLVVLPY